MRVQPLYIIFTQFDPYTLEYLRFFDSYQVNQTTPQIIGFKNCCTDWTNLPPIEKIDVLLFSENHFTNRDAQMLGKIVAEKEKIYLTLRQNASLNLKKQIEKKLFVIAQEKLSLPIREEKHTSGKAFDFLCQIGEYYHYSKRKYINALKDFQKQFKLDLTLEAKFFLWHHCAKIVNEKDFIENTNLAKPLKNSLQTLLSIPAIQTWCQQSKTSLSSTSHLLELRQLLFDASF